MNTEELLKEKGMRITKGRKLIFRIIELSKDAITAEEIYNECKKEKFRVDLSTVYRTLEVFYNEGIVRKFPNEEGQSVYVLKQDCHKHIIRCELCKREVEYDCIMTRIQEIMKKETGFTVSCDDIKIKGICKQCREGKK